MPEYVPEYLSYDIKKDGFGGGTILTPCKYEGEKRYVPYFWEQSLDGYYDYADHELGDSGAVVTFASELDICRFPELWFGQSITLCETNDGYVIEIDEQRPHRPDLETLQRSSSGQIERLGRIFRAAQKKLEGEKDD